MKEVLGIHKGSPTVGILRDSRFKRLCIVSPLLLFRVSEVLFRRDSKEESRTVGVPINSLTVNKAERGQRVSD